MQEAVDRGHLSTALHKCIHPCHIIGLRQLRLRCNVLWPTVGSFLLHLRDRWLVVQFCNVARGCHALASGVCDLMFVCCCAGVLSDHHHRNFRQPVHAQCVDRLRTAHRDGRCRDRHRGRQAFLQRQEHRFCASIYVPLGQTVPAR